MNANQNILICLMIIYDLVSYYCQQSLTLSL